MALHLLCLVGVLLGSLEIQAQDSLPTVTSRLSLSNFSLQPDFQNDKFQGKWYFLTLPEFIGINASRVNLVIHSMTFNLNDDNSYNVSIGWSRNFTCMKGHEVSFPTEEPGVFIFHNVTTDDPSQKMSMKVMSTDYNRIATVVFYKVLNNTDIFTLFIFGRSKELSPEVAEHCSSVARSLSLPAEFTFSDLKEECTAD